VKWGDGGADVQTNAHLFKTQVFQLADYLGVPEDIQKPRSYNRYLCAEQTQKNSFSVYLLMFLIQSGMAGKKIFRKLKLLPHVGLKTRAGRNVIHDI